MKKYTIQASIDELEKKVAAGGSGASAADDISFDNTGTGLSSDNVQDALEELDASVVELDARDNYSTTERVIGKWGDETLYAKIVDCGELPSNTSKTVDPGITNLKAIKNVIPLIKYSGDTSFCEFAGKIGRFQARSTGITITTTENWADYYCDMILWYTKNTVTNNRRKK